MVLCLIVGCHNRSKRDKDEKFFRVPAIIFNQGEEIEERTRDRRERWISAISRDDLTDKILNSDRVCSRHFVSGCPAKSWNVYNIDWVPTLNLGHSKSPSVNVKAKEERAGRAKARRKRQIEQQFKEAEEKRKCINEPGQPVHEINFFGDVLEQNTLEHEMQESTTDAPGAVVDDQCESSHQKQFVEQSCQTDEFDYLFTCSHEFTQTFEEAEFQNDDERVRFYTGLPSFDILMTVFNFISPYVARRSACLTKFQEFIMVLMKLRLNMPFKDLAYRFKNISVSTVSRTFSVWMMAMDVRLSPLISWPEREALWSTMPLCFQYSFGKKVTVIIDCFEVFIDRPSNLLARAQTFSSYKHHNTMKVLIGITPQGTISFTSEAWGGRTSDKFLTENCGFLEKLLPGDMVMADRGFTIHDSVLFKQAQLVIPAFTKGKKQLEPTDVEKTRGIANVRIHVERVIGLLRRKYTILGGSLPIDFLESNPATNSKVPMIDRIIRVCSALVNLCPPIVPFE